MSEKMIIKAEELSANRTKIKLTLSNNVILEGYSLGIEPAFDEDGEELEYNVLIFKPDSREHNIELKNDQIIKVEKAS